MKIGKLSRAVRITDPLEMVGFIRTNGTQCQFVSMLTVTAPKLKKTCPWKDVLKISRRNGLLNVNYNTSVRRRIAKALGVELSEATYENGETWYAHQMTEDGKPLPLVCHKTKNDGKFYVQYFPIRSSGTRYTTASGETIAGEKLEQYFYARKESEYKPAVCCFAVENIKELHASKVIIKTDESEMAEANLAP
jgi:hypothetical protein